MMRYGNGGGWMWAFGGVIMLGVLVLIVVAVWAMITVTKRRDGPVGGAPVANVDPADSAWTRQIVDERYASGELSTEDYTGTGWRPPGSRRARPLDHRHHGSRTRADTVEPHKGANCLAGRSANLLIC